MLFGQKVSSQALTSGGNNKCGRRWILGVARPGSKPCPTIFPAGLEFTYKVKSHMLSASEEALWQAELASILKDYVTLKCTPVKRLTESILFKCSIRKFIISLPFLKKKIICWRWEIVMAVNQSLGRLSQQKNKCKLTNLSSAKCLNAGLHKWQLKKWMLYDSIKY